jgi:hypothetical protein
MGPPVLGDEAQQLSPFARQTSIANARERPPVQDGPLRGIAERGIAYGKESVAGSPALDSVHEPGGFYVEKRGRLAVAGGAVAAVAVAGSGYPAATRPAAPSAAKLTVAATEFRFKLSAPSVPKWP